MLRRFKWRRCALMEMLQNVSQNKSVPRSEHTKMRPHTPRWTYLRVSTALGLIKHLLSTVQLLTKLLRFVLLKSDGNKLVLNAEFVCVSECAVVGGGGWTLALSARHSKFTLSAVCSLYCKRTKNLNFPLTEAYLSVHAQSRHAKLLYTPHTYTNTPMLTNTMLISHKDAKGVLIKMLSLKLHWTII